MVVVYGYPQVNNEGSLRSLLTGSFSTRTFVRFLGFISMPTAGAVTNIFTPQPQAGSGEWSLLVGVVSGSTEDIMLLRNRRVHSSDHTFVAGCVFHTGSSSSTWEMSHAVRLSVWIYVSLGEIAASKSSLCTVCAPSAKSGCAPRPTGRLQ